MIHLYLVTLQGEADHPHAQRIATTQSLIEVLNHLQPIYIIQNEFEEVTFNSVKRL